jgi:hypothetical protein
MAALGRSSRTLLLETQSIVIDNGVRRHNPIPSYSRGEWCAGGCA